MNKKLCIGILCCFGTGSTFAATVNKTVDRKPAGMTTVGALIVRKAAVQQALNELNISLKPGSTPTSLSIEKQVNYCFSLGMVQGKLAVAGVDSKNADFTKALNSMLGINLYTLCNGMHSSKDFNEAINAKSYKDIVDYLTQEIQNFESRIKTEMTSSE